MKPGSTFVNVFACRAISFVPFLANAFERANRVVALSVGIAVVIIEKTFVDVNAISHRAHQAVFEKARLTFATVSAFFIHTLSIFAAIGEPESTFVDIRTFKAVSVKARIAKAAVTARFVDAHGVFGAIVTSGQTFVDIVTYATIAGKSLFAIAFKRTIGVAAFCVAIALVCVCV
jgi:hypothetical protein